MHWLLPTVHTHFVSHVHSTLDSMLPKFPAIWHTQEKIIFFMEHWGVHNQWVWAQELKSQAPAWLPWTRRTLLSLHTGKPCASRCCDWASQDALPYHRLAFHFSVLILFLWLKFCPWSSLCLGCFLSGSLHSSLLIQDSGQMSSSQRAMSDPQSKETT